MWLLLSFTTTKIRNYFETPGELVLYQDSNEYFWSLVYGTAVLILEKFSYYPGEEEVFCSHHPRVVGEIAVPERFAVIIWFVYLHNKNPREVWFSQGRF